MANQDDSADQAGEPQFDRQQLIKMGVEFGPLLVFFLVNALFAAILIGGLLSGRSFLKLVFGDVFRLTEEGWRQLTIRWALFFIALASLNEVVWRNFSTDFWVSFKVFAILPLTMVFALCQVGLLKRHESKS